MLQSRLTPKEHEQRTVRVRSRVVLAATIVSRGFSIQAKIRNLSRAGALIEGEIVPEAGSEIQVMRNGDAVPARVVWAQPGRCGVKFGQRISVEDWIVSEAPSSPIHLNGADADLPSWLSRPVPSESMEDRLPRRVGEELAFVQRLIEAVDRDISANLFIQNRHSGSVHSCRVAASMLADLAKVLLADDRVRAAEESAVNELRSRLLRR